MPSPRQGVSDLPAILLSYQIENVVISPGSRNAPLILTFAKNKACNCISIVDERSAAYYALGMAQQLQKPVVLVCTSGTAALNYAPAIAEAFYLNIPLLVLTADRPPEWIDQQDGQTIRQNNIFHNYVKASFCLPTETISEEDLWLFRRTLSEAVYSSMHDKPGPVHLNIPLRDPLYEELPKPDTKVSGIQWQSPIISSNYTLPHSLLETWKKSHKPWIIVGCQMPDIQSQALLRKISETGEGLVIAENLSNITGVNTIDTPDRFIASLSNQEKEELQADLLITFGGPVVSKKLKKYLRAYPPLEHWQIQKHHQPGDTYKALSHHIIAEPASFLKELSERGTPKKSMVARAIQIQKKTQDWQASYMDSIAFSDLAVFNSIMNHLPEHSILHLANSTPVRYAQLFSTNSTVEFYSNRGTSGIDGCVSTAAGAALANPKLHTLLCGDLAFLYDANALWNNHLPSNLRIIVINNQGGNIFKLIETGDSINDIRAYFETPHHAKIEAICQAHHIAHHKATTKEELERILPLFFEPNTGIAVVEVKTSAEISAQVFKKYYQSINQI